MPPCLIGMEASCVGAHHLSRKLKAFGHDAFQVVGLDARGAILLRQKCC